MARMINVLSDVTEASLLFFLQYIPPTHRHTWPVQKWASDALETTGGVGFRPGPRADQLSASGIWRFTPGTKAHQHPAWQALAEERTRFMLDVSDVWQQEIAMSAQHLSFMRKLSLRFLICQPLVINGKTVGALTLIRTTASNRHFTHDEVADARSIAAGLANVFAN